MTVAFGKSTLSQKSVYKGYKCFTEGWDVNDNERPGVATTSINEENIETVMKMVLKNCWIIIRKVVEDVYYQLAHAMQFSRIF